MKTAFTFKGFEVTVRESKNEKVTAKLDEITMTVDDFSIPEYAQLLVQIPGLIREVGKAFNEIQRDEFELDKDIHAEMVKRAEEDRERFVSSFGVPCCDDDSDAFDESDLHDEDDTDNPFMPNFVDKESFTATKE